MVAQTNGADGDPPLRGQKHIGITVLISGFAPIVGLGPQSRVSRVASSLFMRVSTALTESMIVFRVLLYTSNLSTMSFRDLSAFFVASSASSSSPSDGSLSCSGEALRFLFEAVIFSKRVGDDFGVSRAPSSAPLVFFFSSV